MLVCDRCGAPAGTCLHAMDNDYILQTDEQYRKDWMKFHLWLLALLAVAVLTVYVFLVG